MTYVICYGLDALRPLLPEHLHLHHVDFDGFGASQVGNDAIAFQEKVVACRSNKGSFSLLGYSPGKVFSSTVVKLMLTKFLSFRPCLSFVGGQIYQDLSCTVT